jgi:hypothetical protein
MAGEAEEVPQWARALAADIRFIREALDRAMPVIDAYLDPAASGPGAWAVRRKLAKNKEAP